MQKISEIMTREVQYISPDENVQRAAQMMEQLNVGSIPVCDQDRLIGVITDRDITVRVTAAGKSPQDTKVKEVMTSDVSWCYEDQSVEEVAEQMRDSQVRRMPVVERQSQRMVGIVSLGDLAAKQVGADGAAQTLSDISKPAEPNRQQPNP